MGAQGLARDRHRLGTGAVRAFGVARPPRSRRSGVNSLLPGTVRSGARNGGQSRMAYIVERKTKSGEDRFLVRYRDADTGRTLTSPVFTDRAEAETYKARVEQQERK